MNQEYEKIISAINKREFANIFWLHGEEPFFIDSISSLLERSVLKEEEKDFNQVILYGKEVDFKQVIDQARQFPMMAPYRLVILREAQEMRDIKQLESYILKPSDKTILVVNHKYKKTNARGSLYKSLAKHARIFDSKRLYDNQIPRWIISHSRQKPLQVRAEAAEAMMELLGSDLNKIDNELEKLRVILGEYATVNIDHVNQYIGLSKDFNIFELNNALGSRNVSKAGRIVQYFASNPKNVFYPSIIGSLTNYFARVLIVKDNMSSKDKDLANLLSMSSTYFLVQYKTAARNYSRQKLEQVFKLLEEYDLKIKGVGNRSFDNGELLKELIFKILH